MEHNAKQAQKEKIMEHNTQQSKHATSRRSFLRKGLIVGGAGVIGAGVGVGGTELFTNVVTASAAAGSGSLTKGAVAILTFAPAIESLETDLGQQYHQLGRIQESQHPRATC